MKAVAILTTFGDLPSTYGLVPVVLNQIRQLVKHDYEVGFYTQSGFEKHIDAAKVPKGCELIPRVPFCHIYDYGSGTKEQKHKVDGVGEHFPDGNITNFKKQVKLIEEELEPWLMEYPLIITHDILFQGWFLTHNQAIRNIGKKHPEIKWLHWLHSGPSPRPNKIEYPHTLRFTGMDNSLFISPNNTMRQRFAEMYDVPLELVKTIYHTFDAPRWFELQPLSIEMINRYDLLECEGLVVYPTRVDHAESKGMFEAIHLVAMMNRFANVKFLFLNSASGTERAQNNIRRMKQEAEEWGLPKDNLIFSSEIDPKYINGVPREVVRDMLWIGNMFIHLSESETFSRIMMEAAATKNMIILNEDLGVFKELAEDRVDYAPTGSKWGGNVVDRHYWAGNEPNEAGEENPRKFWYDKAQSLLARLGLVDYTCEHCGEPLGKVGAYNPLRQQRHVLKYFSEEWTWANQLQPLLEGDW